MNEFDPRKREVIHQIATEAVGLPMLDSGLWFHNDIRNNFYYASYLFAAAEDVTLPVLFDRMEARGKASRILALIMGLQDQSPIRSTYGHWPLSLGASPKAAPFNTLPVELMGILLAFFHKEYSAKLEPALQDSISKALNHIYRSQFYRKPLLHYGHHEAKYTASKLVFGQLYEDQELLEDGYQSLMDTLQRVTTKGMSEYSALPWFWHWVQAYTCVWLFTDEERVRAGAAKLLDYLWTLRSHYYIRGAWAGPHSRGLAHDIPRDGNVLFDYVQFGNFELPGQLPRTEYAGFLFYEAPASVRARALNHSQPAEVKRLIPRTPGIEGEPLHSYVYMTEHYAIGGMWERAEEFDNEQHRWDITFPLQADVATNQAYFFLPAVDNEASDLRHQGGRSEVLFHRNVIIALYPDAAKHPLPLSGCLPKGTWLEDKHALFGQCGQVFIAVFIKQAYGLEEQSGLNLVTSAGGPNGVVIECIDVIEAEQKGYRNLEQFAEAMRQRMPLYSDIESVGIAYTALSGDLLKLTIGVNELGEAGQAEPLINGKCVDWSDYTVS
jgi:hypothetical protein